MSFEPGTLDSPAWAPAYFFIEGRGREQFNVQYNETFYALFK